MVTVHIALSGLHLHRPSLAGLRRAARRAARGAATASLLATGVAVVVTGYGLHLVAVAVIAGSAYGGYLIGAHRTAAVLNARHQAVLEGVQRVNSAQQRETARRLAELAAYSAADQEPHKARRDRHFNAPYGRAPVSREGTGR